MANNFLKIRGTYKIEIAKFMAKLRNKKLPTIFYSNFQLVVPNYYTRMPRKI